MPHICMAFNFFNWKIMSMLMNSFYLGTNLWRDRTDTGRRRRLRHEYCLQLFTKMSVFQRRWLYRWWTYVLTCRSRNCKCQWAVCDSSCSRVIKVALGCCPQLTTGCNVMQTTYIALQAIQAASRALYNHKLSSCANEIVTAESGEHTDDR